MSSLIKELLKRPIAFQPAVAKAFDSVTLALLWSQLYYWSEKTSDPEGWIYKTREEITEETSLSRRQQDSSKNLGLKLGVIEYERRGKKGVLHFRINLETTQKLVEEYIKNVVEKPSKGQVPLFKTEKKVSKKEFVPLEEQVNPYRGKYPPAMIEAFLNHYTQATDSGKQLWQKIKDKGAFQVGNRLATWKKNTDDWAYQKSQKQQLKKVDEKPVHRDRPVAQENGGGFSSLGSLMDRYNVEEVIE